MIKTLNIVLKFKVILKIKILVTIRNNLHFNAFENQAENVEMHQNENNFGMIEFRRKSRLPRKQRIKVVLHQFQLLNLTRVVLELLHFK